MTGGLVSRDQPLSPGRVCSANSVHDRDRSFRAPVRQRGGFPSFHRSEGRVFPDTRSSVVEEATEVPVGRDSLSVQGPVLWTVDCPSGLHQGVCSRVCVGALPRDSSSSVPGRLAGPYLFGGGGQKERPGSALRLSLPRDRDKREVKSSTLVDCKLPRYDHRYRGRQDFSVPCAGREISVGGGDVLYYVRSPRSALADGFGSPGFTGETGSSQSTSIVLTAVAFEDALVSRVGSSLIPDAYVPGGERGFVLMDGEGPSSQGGSIWGTRSGTTSVLGRVTVGVGRTPPQSSSVRGMVGAGEVAAHQSSRNEGIVSGIAVISGVGHRLPCDRNVRQLDDGGLCQHVPFAHWPASF